MKKLAVFLLAVFVIASAAQAGMFSSLQSVNVVDSAWTKTYVMDLTSFVNQKTTVWTYGNYNCTYSINYYSHWFGLYIYDDSYGGWDELIYLWNQNL